MCNKEISESETWSSVFLSFVFPLMYLEIRKKANDIYFIFFYIGNCQTVIGQNTCNPLPSPPLCCLRHKQIYTSCLIFSPWGKKKKKVCFLFILTLFSGNTSSLFTILWVVTLLLKQVKLLSVCFLTSWAVQNRWEFLFFINLNPHISEMSEGRMYLSTPPFII